MTHGGVLHDEDGNDSSTPEQDKLEANRKLKRDSIGRIFAFNTRPGVQVLEKITIKENETK